MTKRARPLPLTFWIADDGREPVREWLDALPPEDQNAIAREIARAQFGWPLAPPALRRLSKDLWELRASLPNAGEALVAFGYHAGELIALKAVAKKPSAPRAEHDASPAPQSEETTP
jgi:hypothetical protein